MKSAPAASLLLAGKLSTLRRLWKRQRLQQGRARLVGRVCVRYSGSVAVVSIQESGFQEPVANVQVRGFQDQAGNVQAPNLEI